MLQEACNFYFWACLKRGSNKDVLNIASRRNKIAVYVRLSVSGLQLPVVETASKCSRIGVHDPRGPPTNRAGVRHSCRNRDRRRCSTRIYRRDWIVPEDRTTPSPRGNRASVVSESAADKHLDSSAPAAERRGGKYHRRSCHRYTERASSEDRECDS